MLIAKIYVNSRQIDEIHIQNVTKHPNSCNNHEYRIRKPKIDNILIKHDRSAGYKPLLTKALQEIINHGILL